MNRNVKDYLILKGDFDFAVPWITLPEGAQGLKLGPLELSMEWNAEVWLTRRTNTWTDRREGGNSSLDSDVDVNSKKWNISGNILDESLFVE